MEKMLENFQQQPSILERLRQKLVVVDPTTEEEEREKMNLIIQHESKFPSKLREAIRDIAGENESKQEPSVFLSKMFKATTAFFCGQRYRVDEEAGNQNNNREQETTLPSDWWHGLDVDIDTEEEAELAIRFFPDVLKEKYKSLPSSLKGSFPIYILMTCSKAMFFVPLLAELGVELGGFTEQQRGGLCCTFRAVFLPLVDGRLRRDKFEDENPEKIEEVSLAIMKRLKEKGLMKKEDIYNNLLVSLLLYRAVHNDDFAMEKRFRFFIDWDPFILKDCNRSNPLLYHFVRYMKTTDDAQIHARTLQVFRLIFKSGLSHFPSEVGFLFHKNTFQVACEKFGTKPITQLIEDEMSKYLNQNQKKIQDMIFSAATNDEISTDGLYTLFRRDPMAILSKRSKEK